MKCIRRLSPPLLISSWISFSFYTTALLTAAGLKVELILLDMRSHVKRAVTCHESSSFIALVAGDSEMVRNLRRTRYPSLSTKPLPHRQPMLALGAAAGLPHLQVDQEAIAIFHQRTLGVTELGFFAGPFLASLASGSVVD